MKKILPFLLSAALLFAACKEEAKEQPKEQAQNVPAEVAEAVVDSVVPDTVPEVGRDTADFSGRVQDFYVHSEIVDPKEIPATGSLVGLFYEDSAYYLRQEKISFVNYYHDCYGDSVIYFDSKAIYLFLNFKDYNKGEIKNIPLPKIEDSYNRKIMLPGSVFVFEFGGETHQIEAFGEDDGNRNITNYSLVYSIRGTDKKQTIVNINKTDDSTFELLFIGDLDGDGKPDLIVNAPVSYISSAIRLFLSSTAKEGQLLRYEGITGYDVDC